MLRTRVLTASALFVLLLLVAYSGSFLAFVVVTAVFFAAAMWESFRLFGNRQPMVAAAIWTLAFGIIIYYQRDFAILWLFFFCAAIWAFRLAPSLAWGLPPLHGVSNRLLNGVYGIAILGSFLAMLVLYQQSPLYLLSVMAIVWVADIGAYFSGKAFGKRKLAPSISPGKSWEGAIGGWLAVLVFTGLTALLPVLKDTFAVKLLAHWGWLAWLAGMTVLVVASVVGDLFESQLKRRVAMKDSSHLLPGHGGVLDRIDALIPTLPLAVLIGSWF